VVRTVGACPPSSASSASTCFIVAAVCRILGPVTRTAASDPADRCAAIEDVAIHGLRSDLQTCQAREMSDDLDVLGNQALQLQRVVGQVGSSGCHQVAPGALTISSRSGGASRRAATVRR
jgi:hypothetical protein